MAEFGLIFHWGLYSVPAFDSIRSARRRKLQNGSEWYLKRLVEKGTFRPISGWKETQAFHKKNYGDEPYESFKLKFKPKFKPREWMKLAKSIGATYVILTARHHDGFCLWDTKTTDYKYQKQDLLMEFVEAAKEYGLKYGIYYSWGEFTKNMTKQYVNEVVYPQITELVGYNPDIWWFDGHWMIKTKFAKESVDKLCKCITKVNPKVIINDRLGIEKSGKNYYKVFEDRHIPTKAPSGTWEHINTIGLSWGRNVEQEEKDYKTPEELLELYNKVTKLKGKFLLNLGPDKDGNLDPIEVERLLEFRKLLDEE